MKLCSAQGRDSQCYSQRLDRRLMILQIKVSIGELFYQIGCLRKLSLSEDLMEAIITLFIRKIVSS